MNIYKKAFDEFKKVIGLTGKDKFFDSKLADGITKVSIGGEKLEPEATIDIVAEDLTLSPLQSGEYTLETGEILVVEDGIIKQIIPLEEPAAADMKEAVAPVETKTENSEFNSALATTLEALVKKVEELEKSMKEQHSAAEKMSKLVEIIGAMPSDNPVVKVEPVQFKTEKEVKKANSKETIADIMKKVNSNVTRK